MNLLVLFWTLKIQRFLIWCKERKSYVAMLRDLLLVVFLLCSMTNYIIRSWKGIKFKLSSLKNGILMGKWKYTSLGRKIYYGGKKTSSLPLILISRRNCKLVLKTDACITCWVKVLNTIFANAFFTSEESNCHITALEWKTSSGNWANLVQLPSPDVK